LVLVHGANATSASWAPLVPALAADRPVLAVDTLGEAGESVQRAPVPDPPARARWLDEVLTPIAAAFWVRLAAAKAARSPPLRSAS
jgi:pimeloyl-ACP methyl ester carboxylesterase